MLNIRMKVRCDRIDDSHELIMGNSKIDNLIFPYN